MEEPIATTDEERPPTSQAITSSNTTFKAVQLPTTIPTTNTELPSPLTDKIKQFAASITNVTEKQFMEEVTNTTKWSCGSRADINEKNNNKNSTENKKNSSIIAANSVTLYWQNE
jgi:enamine deaminase RidA (YjgF/YER057c/UK114 family)